jgi:hypothetical protein
MPLSSTPEDRNGGKIGMTWIKTISPTEADSALRKSYEAINALYPPEYHHDVASLVRPDGTTDSVTAAHSLIPEAMRHAMSTLGVLLAQDLPLSRRQQEMIAAVVSVDNRCFY